MMRGNDASLVEKMHRYKLTQFAKSFPYKKVFVEKTCDKDDNYTYVEFL